MIDFTIYDTESSKEANQQVNDDVYKTEYKLQNRPQSQISNCYEQELKKGNSKASKYIMPNDIQDNFKSANFEDSNVPGIYKNENYLN